MPDINKVWEALHKYGIYTEQQLDEAIKKMKPINIGYMVSKELVKEIPKLTKEEEKELFEREPLLIEE